MRYVDSVEDVKDVSDVASLGDWRLPPQTKTWLSKHLELQLPFPEERSFEMSN